MFHYKPGKMDWLAFGLPAEGKEKSALLIEHIERRFPTCSVRDSVQRARQTAAGMNFTLCPVVNEENVVLGLIRASGESKGGGDSPAGEVMELGPKTLRPSASTKEATATAQKNDWAEILVTSSDGKLLGIFKARGEASRSEQNG